MTGNGILKRCTKARHQMVGKALHETNGVGEHGCVSACQVPTFNARSKCCKEFVSGIRPAPRQCIEEARFTGIGVANQRSGVVLVATLLHFA